MNYTLSIIKPDGVRRNLQGKILSRIQEEGFIIIAQKMIKLTMKDAQTFYAIHKERPFFDDLCKQMCSGPISIQVLKALNAVKKHRDLMGATNPADSEDGTLRKMFGISIDENTIHGSDSDENAELEISQMFKKEEIFV